MGGGGEEEGADSSQGCPVTRMGTSCCPGNGTCAEEKHFYYEGGQTLAQVVLRCCGVCVLRGTKNLAGPSLEQLALADPALGWRSD